ncbi:MAG TPA: HNH endonuclease [Thermomicrobiales bacterium]|nr:HNH endonuclease [Thermomicrobiales bacterium]
MRPEYTPEFISRFESRVDRSGDCHIWIGVRHRQGYGEISCGGKMLRAHRVAWEIANGQIPPEMCVCHACDNPSCVRTDHLWLGTQRENMRDAAKKGRVAAQRHPERIPRGDNHYSKQHPERVASGDRNGARTRPDRVPRGELNGSSRLTADQVREIRRLGATTSQRAIAQAFGVHFSTISGIISGKRWRHLL